MMVSDRSEAFRHNSCKKLAQLGKVIFTMSLKTENRLVELAALKMKYEASLRDILQRRQQSQDAVQRSLANFRKSCVENACREWGAVYKVLRNDLVAIATRYSEQIASVMSEIQKTAKELDAIQTSALGKSDLVQRTADSTITNLRKKSRPTTANKRSVRVQVQPIYDKIDALLTEKEALFEAQRAEHARGLARERGNMGRALREAFGKQGSPFVTLRKQTSALRSEVQHYRQQYTKLVEERAAFNQIQKTWRTRLMIQVREQNKTMNQQAAHLRDQRKLNEQGHSVETADLMRLLKQAKLSHQSKLEVLNQDLLRHERQARKYLEAHEAEIKKRELDSQSIEEQITNQFNAEKKRRTDFHTQILNHVGECDGDSRRILGLVRQSIDSGLGKVRAAMANIRSNVERQSNEMAKRLNDQRSEFVAQGGQHLRDLESASEAQIACDQRAEQNHVRLIGQLQTDRQRIAAETSRLLDRENANYGLRLDEIHLDQRCQLEKRTQDLSLSFERRRTEKANRLSDLDRTFQTDLDQKCSDWTAANAARLADLKVEWLKQAASSDHIDTHATALGRAKSALDFLNRKFVIAHEDRDKTMATLDGEMTQLEKVKRRFERRKRTEAAALSEDYERQIQVAQVQVLNSMENIAKLYDTEENERGCEIIEAIRRVRDTGNEVDDSIMRIRQEMTQLRRSSDAKKSALRDSIASLKSGARETDLESAIRAVQPRVDRALFQNREQVDGELRQLRQGIEAETTGHKRAVDELGAATTMEAAEYQKQCQIAEGQKREAVKETENALHDIDSEFGTARTKLVRDHENATGRLKSRIASARQQLTDISARCETEHRNAENRNRLELTQSEPVIAPTLGLGDKAENLNQTIAVLSKRAKDAESRFANPPVRNSEQSKMDALRTSMQTQDGTLADRFEMFYTMVRDAPRREHRDSKPEPRAEAMRPLTACGDRVCNNSMSRGTRRPMSRLYNPGDSKFRRRGHVVISAQVA
jgi:hypothetical protein